MLTRTPFTTLASSVLALAAGCSLSVSPPSPSGNPAPPGGAAAPSPPPPSTTTPPSTTATPSTTTTSADTVFLLNETPGPGQTGTSSIYAVHTDGTKTLLTDDGRAPSWTPAGAILFVSNRSGSQQIWMMDGDGGNARQVGQLAPSFSPIMPQLGKNGLIVFSDMGKGDEENPGIWVMHEDGSELRQLTNGQMPFLASSGTWMAYTVGTLEPYHREIWRMNTDGTGVQQLTFTGDVDYPDANAPSISPDEKTVAFFSGKESDRGAAGFIQSILTFGHRNVAVVSAAGGARKTLTPCTPVTTQAELDALTGCLAADNPAWSPDGSFLVFDTGFKTGTETWRVDLEGHGFARYYEKSRGVVRVALRDRT